MSRTWNYRWFVAASLGAVLTASPRAFADYPIASHRYLADPGSLVYNGRVYLYNSNDDDNAVGGGYAMKSVVCVSSSDMKNWTDHGIVFSVPANASWANNSWAPQPIERNGTIYLYFGNSGSGVGVASSKDPTGGFKDAKGSYLVNGSTPGASGTDSWLFDPGALIDEDGQAYLSFGGNGENNARIIKLGADLASVSGSAAQLSPKGFFEASFMFKRNKIYYMAYSTNPANGLRIDYLSSSSPMSGYTYGGIVADQPPSNNDNNHASEFVFKDNWYHAYHNRIVAMTAGISATYKRNLALEVLSFNADGTIKKVTYTKDGVPQVGTLDPYVRVEAETMNAQSGIETETCSAGGMDVTQISSGDWVAVRGVDFGSGGAKSFSARVASTSSGGSIELRLGSLTGTLAGTCTVPSTGGAQTWMTATCDVTGATGVKDLYLKFGGSGFNVDYWQFTPVNGGAGGAGGGGTGSGGQTGTAGSNGTGGTAGGAVAGSGGRAGTGGGNSARGGAGGVPGSAGAAGGQVGSAGSPGLGGAAVAGASGFAGRGGATAGNGGPTGAAGVSAGKGGATAGAPGSAGTDGGDDHESAGGCSCLIAGRSSAPATPLLLFVAALIGRRRRRTR
jgi:arabinoxylan arabinofuranohydrolase